MAPQNTLLDLKEVKAKNLNDGKTATKTNELNNTSVEIKNEVTDSNINENNGDDTKNISRNSNSSQDNPNTSENIENRVTDPKLNENNMSEIEILVNDTKNMTEYLKSQENLKNIYVEMKTETKYNKNPENCYENSIRKNILTDGCDLNNGAKDEEEWLFEHEITAPCDCSSIRPDLKSPDIDGGWAWVVFIAGFLQFFVASAMYYSFSAFFVELVKEFNEPRAKVGWVYSTNSAIHMFCGPLGGWTNAHWGPRVTVMLGGLCACVGYLGSAFSPSLNIIFFTYGIINGIGTSLNFSGWIVGLGKFWRQKKCFVTGIAMAGSGVGVAILGPVISTLVNTYGWRGAMLFSAGLSLHLCVLGATIISSLRPPRRLKKNCQCRGIGFSEIGESLSEESLNVESLSRGSLNVESLSRGSLNVGSLSRGSLNVESLSRGRGLKRGSLSGGSLNVESLSGGRGLKRGSLSGERGLKRGSISGMSIGIDLSGQNIDERIGRNIDERIGEDRENYEDLATEFEALKMPSLMAANSLLSLANSEKHMEKYTENGLWSFEYTQKNKVEMYMKKNSLRSFEYTSKSNGEIYMEGNDLWLSENTEEKCLCSFENTEKYTEKYICPFENTEKNICSFENMGKNREKQKKNGLWSFAKTGNGKTGKIKSDSAQGIAKTKSRAQDVAKSPGFWLLQASCFLSSMSTTTIFAVLFDWVEWADLGGAFSASLAGNGAGDVGGRVLAGLIASRGSPMLLFSGAQLLLASSIAGAALATSTVQFMIMMVGVGLACGLQSVLQALLPSQLCSGAGVGHVLGWQLVVAGLGALAGPPIAGVMVDSTHSYVPVLILCTVAPAVASCLSLIAHCLTPRTKISKNNLI